MPPYTRLELNALIERLIGSRGEDAEARAAVAALARSIKPASAIGLKAAVRTRGGSMTGATPEHGDIKIEDRNARTHALDLGLGASQRIGHWKVTHAVAWRYLCIREVRVLITSCRDTDEQSMLFDTHTQTWCLACTAGLDPSWFGEFQFLPLRIGPLRFCAELIRETWHRNGRRGPRLHARGVTIEIGC